MTRIGLPAIALAALLVTGCDDQAAQKTPPPGGPPEVTVAAPLQKTITEWDEFTGRFEAVETVDLRARVSGYLNSIHFRDGQIVAEGARLFVIDPRRFEIAVQQAKASVDQARAQLTLARSDLERAVPLAKRRNIPARELEAREAAVSEAVARLPSFAAWIAARCPAGPEPITSMSKSYLLDERSAVSVENLGVSSGMMIPGCGPRGTISERSSSVFHGAKTVP